MWLYCLALLGTAAIIIPMAYSIDVVFLRLVTALLITAGFTFAAVYISRASLGAIFGRAPTAPSLILSVLIGVAIWIPASWLRSTLYIWLNTAVGWLPPPLPSAAPPLSVFIQAAVIIPLCHGFLFWAYIQRAADGLGKARGAVLTAALYALYGLFTTDGALSSVPELFVVGLFAAFVAAHTGSAWTGILVLAGYGVAAILLESALFNFLGEQYVYPFSVRWLLIVVITAFIAFILFQVVRLRASTQPEGDKPPRRAPKGTWWIPLAISIVLFLFGAFTELTLRAATGQPTQSRAAPRSVAPPVAATPRSAPPVVVPSTPTPPR